MYFKINHLDLKIRDCFSQKEKKYIDYCLKEKVGGISIPEAAKRLGIFKQQH
jgi:hypothetical protein